MRHFVALVIASCFLASPVFAASFTVNDPGDAADNNPGDGTCATAGAVCTLRAAIDEANAFTGADSISFSISGTIAPASPYASLIEQVTINGGSAITIDGTSTVGTAFDFAAGSDNSVLQGLTIHGFTGGAVTVSSSGVSIHDNTIGPNLDGIQLLGSDNTNIGTNTLSGNTRNGIRGQGTNHTIHDNTIATNGADGIFLFGDTTTIAISTNTIGGNGGDGIELHGVTAVTISGNSIGTSAPNGGHGVNLSNGAANNSVSGNTISNNGGSGVNVEDFSNANDILGNTITGNGTGITANGSNMSIGSVASPNTISGNSGNGVTIAGSANNVSAIANSIVSNGALGIDLGADGVTANDGQDADSGPNGFQNYPTLTAALTSGSQSIIGGTLNSTPNSTFALHFYSNATPDPSTYGEGQSYLGTTNVTTDSNGDASFSFTGPALTIGNAVTATATGAEGTSEFALNVTAGAVPTIAFSSGTYSVAENGSSIVITVTRSGDLSLSSTVDYATSNGSATAGSDYTAASGTLTFAAGVASQTFTVSILDDTIDEPNETVNLTLSNPTGATLTAPSSAVLTINDDDPAPSITINDVTLSEGNSGTTAFTFNVTLSNPSASTITVAWATADGTATAGSDYTAASGTLTFNPGVVTQPVTVNVTGDTTFEPNETFFVNLTNATNASITDNQGLGTINNDDGVPSISINDVALSEGNSGTTPFTFTVTLSSASGVPVTVDYATADGTATAGSDYTATSGTLTFAPSVTSQTITVNVNGDTSFEPNETFFVNLTNPTNASISDNQGLGTIDNDDAPPAADLGITKSTASTTFTPGQQISYTITVTNSGPSPATNTVVTDVLPAGATYVSATPTQGSCSGTTTVTCSLGTLANAASATITLVVTANGTTAITNSASVTAVETDPTPANNAATATIVPATAIPTLNEYALLALALLLAAMAAMKMR